MNLVKIVIYTTYAGKEPYSIWEDGLDKKIRAHVANRIDRIKLGNFGDAKLIKGVAGLWELRITKGPGYRIYFGKKGATIVILLTAGDKKTQKKDIAKAKEYWKDCKESL